MQASRAHRGPGEIASSEGHQDGLASGPAQGRLDAQGLGCSGSLRNLKRRSLNEDGQGRSACLAFGSQPPLTC